MTFVRALSISEPQVSWRSETCPDPVIATKNQSVINYYLLPPEIPGMAQHAQVHVKYQMSRSARFD